MTTTKATCHCSYAPAMCQALGQIMLSGCCAHCSPWTRMRSDLLTATRCHAGEPGSHPKRVKPQRQYTPNQGLSAGLRPPIHGHFTVRHGQGGAGEHFRPPGSQPGLVSNPQLPAAASAEVGISSTAGRSSLCSRKDAASGRRGHLPHRAH